MIALDTEDRMYGLQGEGYRGDWDVLCETHKNSIKKFTKKEKEMNTKKGRAFLPAPHLSLSDASSWPLACVRKSSRPPYICKSGKKILEL